MIFTATVARNHHGTAFKDLSTEMMMKCVRFLLNTRDGGGDVLALVMTTKANFPEANFDILRDIAEVVKTVLQLPVILFFGCISLCQMLDVNHLQIGTT